MSLLENSGPLRVELRKVEKGYSLFRGGEPFFVKGAAGFDRVKELAEAGGNSLRTWGYDQAEKVLPDIRRYGLTLCTGLWLVPPRQGFDYSDAGARLEQFEALKRQVLALASEPSLLVWGVGNELELGVESVSPDVWKSVEELAAFIKKTDPLRPVTTVLASVNEAALQGIAAFCPSIDFVSFNAYGDLERVQSKLDGIGWDLPYLVTEWGANGHWEVRQTRWGAEIEPTSSEKAIQVRRRYRSLAETQGQCLGSYIFLWGNKQERTATWYGLYDQDGRPTESVDAIGALWTDREELGVCPQISSLQLAGGNAEESVTVRAGERVEASYALKRGEFSSVSAYWAICCESCDKKQGGDFEANSEEIETRFENLGEGGVGFSAPLRGGEYRLLLSVRSADNWLATANLPFRVEA